LRKAVASRQINWQFSIMMKEHIDIAISAALKAGKEILEVYNTADFQVEMKSDNSPLTIADKRSHVAIAGELEKTDVPVLSEEGKQLDYSERGNWTWLWVVDPLDGTKEFIKRNGEFTVNIALVNGQDPVAGVIYVPVTGTLYVGIVGEGAYMIEASTDAQVSWDSLKNSGTSIPQNSERAYTVVGSRSHMSAETEEFMNGLKKEHGEIEILSRGSSLKLCMVAEGKADVYPRFAPTMEWDTAAGHGICAAAGFKVLKYPEMTPLKYNKEDLLNPWFIVKS
jgi:3'(2'), 5'-bisphosphate nucleotidase